MSKHDLSKAVKEIKNKKIRDWTNDWLENKTPDYFWEIPASSTGKYHPSFAQGKGGLVRHTRVAIQIALELFTINDFSQIEQDIIIAALILHDTLKHGRKKSKYSNASHGRDLADEIRKECTSDSIRAQIANAIDSHMGQWNTNFRKQVVANKPKTKIEHFVHLCDYLASRKVIEINFDEMKV